MVVWAAGSSFATKSLVLSVKKELLPGHSSQSCFAVCDCAVGEVGVCSQAGVFVGQIRGGAGWLVCWQVRGAGRGDDQGRSRQVGRQVGGDTELKTSAS